MQGVELVERLLNGREEITAFLPDYVNAKKTLMAVRAMAMHCRIGDVIPGHARRMATPPIAEVPAGVHRPLGSVMIPTHNCSHFLAQTLQSVLSQDPGPAAMEINVVDDGSTQDGASRYCRSPLVSGAHYASAYRPRLGFRV